ncbi:hypothetical protein E1B28_009679 [Marasmius oreades]|uniref:C2H2-type domain-containing protein n=1 Tax=Marasmius oreades TaxID=181124 RepID=A0A9P7UQC6_9AGAR|nr:uncharacterized protein E1B28_009679 [Marasmius oreades]KAG7090572.1 hypothetical protein E1B28_009679 [Marasmius oreades]
MSVTATPPHHYSQRPTASYINFSSIDNYPTFQLPVDGDTTGGANAIQNFSDGSPQALHYLDHEYRSLFDSGEASTSASMPTLQHATGMTHPDYLARPFSDLYPEEIPPYQHLWFPPSTHDQPLEPPSSLLNSDPHSTRFPHKKSISPSRASTSTRLPTLSEMAVTLNPSAERPPPPPSMICVNEPNSVGVAPLGAECTLTRERRHACSMCHKRFDRPSTLRKHLLVHTGEKAFQCEACGRRFGVASNLNRHIRRCLLKPVNVVQDTTPSSTDGEDRSRRSSTTSPVAESLDPTITTTATRATSKSLNQKRRRRAPSPARWIPASLLNFNLEPPQKTASVPLPPVRPSEWDNEERDSFDENVGAAPYHPREWQYKPFLPGPGIASGFGSGRRSGGRGQMFGSLLVF